MIFSAPHYALNGKRIKGTTALLLKTLETLKHPVVTFNLEEVEGLSDFERIPYIMQTIKQKIRSDFLGSDSAV